MEIIFSVIVPVYRVSDYLEKCIESILQQTYQDFELILVDDGSPDDCPQICDRYGAEAHSTYASIIVSYGLIGSIWFLYIFYNILRGKTRLITIKNVMVMSGVALYGVSHNGIRNTLLWIFFALMMLCNADDYNEQLNGKVVTI